MWSADECRVLRFHKGHGRKAEPLCFAGGPPTGIDAAARCRRPRGDTLRIDGDKTCASIDRAFDAISCRSDSPPHAATREARPASSHNWRTEREWRAAAHGSGGRRRWRPWRFAAAPMTASRRRSPMRCPIASPTPDSASPAAIHRWWTKLGSSELNRLVAAADVDNLDIAVAVAQLEATKAQARDRWRRALARRSTFTDNNSRSKGSGTGSPGVIANPPPRNSLSRQFSASLHPRRLGPQSRAARCRPACRDRLGLSGRGRAPDDVLGTVVDNFLVHAASRERLDVARSNLANAERVLGVIRERVAAGTASEFDTAQQGTLGREPARRHPTLRQAAETARTAIALAVGRPVQSVSICKIRNLRRSAARRHRQLACRRTCSCNRPDIRAAEQSLAAADADVAGRPRGVPAGDPDHRPDGRAERPALDAVPAAVGDVGLRRQRHADDLRRRPPARPAGDSARRSAISCSKPIANGARRHHRRRERTDRHSARPPPARRPSRAPSNSPAAPSPLARSACGRARRT